MNETNAQPVEFPQTLYCSPDEWGNPTNCGRGKMVETMEELKAAGEEWKTITIDQCAKLEKLAQTEKAGLYIYQYGRDNETLFCWVYTPETDAQGKIYPGYFSFDSELWADGDTQEAAEKNAAAAFLETF